MREFFAARLSEERRHQASRAPFRLRFFANDCRYDSRVETLRRMESEHITQVDEEKSGSYVVTEQTFHYSAGKKPIRLRYHLQRLNDDWLIRDVQTACFVCDGYGDANCSYCKGKQWLGTEQVREEP